MKAKDSPTQRKTDALESGKASDSGYSSLREAKSADPLRRKTSNEKRSENDDRVMSPNKQALKNEVTTGDDPQSANEPIKNFAERKSKDNVADIKNERKSRSTHKDEKINKEEGSGEKQVSLRQTFSRKSLKNYIDEQVNFSVICVLPLCMTIITMTS